MSWKRSSAATATHRISSRATTPTTMHQLMAATLDTVVADNPAHPDASARANGFTVRPRWPMIVLRSPKGWTGPKVVDGKRTEGTFRSHQVPMGDMATIPATSSILREVDEELSSARSCSTRLAGLFPNWPNWRPKGARRMGANPHANGGLLLRDLRLPDFRDYAVEVPQPGCGHGRGHAGAGQVHPRRHEAQRKR